MNTAIAIYIPISAVLIAALVAWINYRNHALAVEKLKLELFEKRFAVYKAAQLLLTQVFQDADIKTLNQIIDFRRDTQAAYFLFDQDVVSYLESLDRKALDLWAKSQSMRSADPGDARTKLALEAHDIAHQLIEELPQLKTAFELHLRFKTWS